ncbi:MAG: ImmA/IrrE family metallo-endopeptidase [Pirellulales bacterium]
MTSSRISTQALIDELVRSTGASDAEAAIRLKAKELISLWVSTFGDATMPISVDGLASLCGIGRSEEPPLFSPDAELIPDGTGGVTMRVNPDRPETRQRFSVAHEISHTFFPNYSSKPWCRTDARYRDRHNPEDRLEMLCDIGAAELLFPQPWFSRDAVGVINASGLTGLAATYHASREATLRRFVEASTDSLAAVFFSWKLKPTQKGTVGSKDQSNFLGITAEDELREALRLRIEYAIVSDSFKAEGYFLPKDKSVESEGPIFDAASTGEPADGECHLDLGQAAGTYRIWAVPLFTADDQLGVGGANTVAALLRPLDVRRPRRKTGSGNDPKLFAEC